MISFILLSTIYKKKKKNHIHIFMSDFCSDFNLAFQYFLDLDMIFKPGNRRVGVFKGIYKKISTRIPNFLCSFEKRNNLTVYTVNIEKPNN